MNDMGRIDPMYQFSLDAYVELFSNSIDKSLKHPKLEERIEYLNDYHTFAVYQLVRHLSLSLPLSLPPSLFLLPSPSSPSPPLFAPVFMLVYYFPVRYTCRGLFERHKLLFSFQMCVKIMENASKLNMDEYSFFLRGGVVSY